MNAQIVLKSVTDRPTVGALSCYARGNKVAKIIQPVREVELTDSVELTYRGERLPLEPSTGSVYSVTFLDGSKRELFVPSESGKEYFDLAVFLKSGRKTNSSEEVKSLEIRDLYDRPSPEVRSKLKQNRQARIKAFAAPQVK